MVSNQNHHADMVRATGFVYILSFTDKIKELPPYSWRQATVHRTVVLDFRILDLRNKNKRNVKAFLLFLVRATGFEPAASSSQS